MKRVIQKDRTGCGLACIAMLAGRTYQEVRKAAVALNIEKAGEFYTHAIHLKELGAVFNIHIPAKRWRVFRSWGELPDTALVAINPRDGGLYWHWVVFMRRDGSEFVLDPRESVKTERRTDFGRMRAARFLPVA